MAFAAIWEHNNDAGDTVSTITTVPNAEASRISGPDIPPGDHSQVFTVNNKIRPSIILLTPVYVSSRFRQSLCRNDRNEPTHN